jgi:hypothetical protein
MYIYWIQERPLLPTPRALADEGKPSKHHERIEKQRHVPGVV